MKPISDSGREAYINSNGHLYNSASEEFKESYREAWRSDNRSALERDMSGEWEDTAWELHRREFIDNFAEPSGNNAVGSMGRSLAGLAVAIVFVAFIFACLLGDNSDFAWRTR